MANLNLRVLVDVVGADKLSGLGNTMQRTGLNLTKFVTLPLLGAGAGMLALAADAEKADAKLQNTFDNMGAAAFTSIDALNQQADAMGQLSQFDDEGIKEAQATLLSFGQVTEASFDRGLQASVDLAEFFGTDLQSATVQVGKALNDPIKGLTSLGRMGVQFTEDQKATIAGLVEMGDVAGAQAIILGELERQVGGTAAALANTNAGDAAQAFEDLGNAGESLGTIFLPMLGSLAKGISSLAQGFMALPEPMKGTIIGIGALVAAIGPAIFIGGKLISSFKAIGVAFNVLKLLMLTNPFTALAVAVAAIAALIILNWDKITEFLRKTWNVIMGGILTLAQRLRSVWDTITGAVSTAWNGLIGIIKGAINGIIGLINGFIGFINGIQIHVPAFQIGPVSTPAFDWWGLGLPQIPYLAEGGIITRPTLALLGEQGPEAVIPLDEDMGGTHFHSHIEVRGEDPFIRNPDDLIRVQQRIAFLEGF